MNTLLFAGLLPPELNLTEMAMGVTGVGFAVAIVRDMAENHGWQIRVTDGDDDGARFGITDVDLRE